MKKQIIAAAVAASLSAVALADVSISGAAQANITKKDLSGQPTVSHDVDIKVTGKSGDTTFVVDLENTSLTSTLANGKDALQVKNAYMTTDLGGIKVKAGEWYNGDSNLNDASQQGARAEFSTDMSGVSAKFAMEPSTGGNAGLYEMHLGADLAGVKVNYEQENQDNHKIISVAGSLAGVDFQYVDSRSDNATGVLNAGGVTGGGNEITTASALIVGHQYKVTAAGSTPGTEADLLALSPTGATESNGTTAMTDTSSDTLAVGVLFTPTVTTAIGGDTELDDLNTVKALGGLDGNDETTYIISTNLGGVKIEYQKMESRTGTTSDGFFGTFDQANLLEADGFGLTTSLAGNTVQIRNYKTVTEVDGVAGGTHTDQSTAAGSTELDSSAATSKKRDTKIIVTRPLASGATAEFTYLTGDSENFMDLEFRMTF